jgi:hypothetical protein
MQDDPTPAELTIAVAKFLRRDLLPSLKGLPTHGRHLPLVGRGARQGALESLRFRLVLVNLDRIGLSAPRPLCPRSRPDSGYRSRSDSCQKRT